MHLRNPASLSSLILQTHDAHIIIKVPRIFWLKKKKVLNSDVGKIYVLCLQLSPRTSVALATLRNRSGWGRVGTILTYWSGCLKAQKCDPSTYSLPHQQSKNPDQLGCAAAAAWPLCGPPLILAAVRPRLRNKGTCLPTQDWSSLGVLKTPADEVRAQQSPWKLK